MATFEFHNISGMSQRLKSLSGEMRSNANSALESEAETIAQRSRDEFVPVLFGVLRDSIRVVKSHISQGRNARGQFTGGTDIEVSIIAGGDDIPYAHTVHETPSPHDPPSWEGKTVHFTTGGPKYLERPIREAEKGMAGRIAAKMKV